MRSTLTTKDVFGSPGHHLFPPTHSVSFSAVVGLTWNKLRGSECLRKCEFIQLVIAASQPGGRKFVQRNVRESVSVNPCV